MCDVTQILSQIEDGDGQAAEKLLPLVYDELRKLAPTFRASRRHFVPKFRGKHPISSQSDFRL